MKIHKFFLFLLPVIVLLGIYLISFNFGPQPYIEIDNFEFVEVIGSSDNETGRESVLTTFNIELTVHNPSLPRFAWDPHCGAPNDIEIFSNASREKFVYSYMMCDEGGGSPTIIHAFSQTPIELNNVGFELSTGVFDLSFVYLDITGNDLVRLSINSLDPLNIDITILT